MVRRFLLGFLLLMLFVIPVLEVPLGLSYSAHQVDQLTSQVERDAFFLAAYSEERLEGSARTNLDTVVRNYEKRTGGRVVVVGADGTVIVDSDPPVGGSRSMASRPEIATALKGKVATGTRHSNTLHQDLLYVAVPVTSSGNIDGAVRVTYPRAKVDHQIRRHWLGLGAMAVLSISSAALVAILVARSVARPLLQVQHAAVKLGDGDLSARAPETDGPPEIRDLARAFNNTAVRLQQLVGAQQSFVADASHQLRTPLTALRLRLENLEAESGTEQRDDVAAAEDEVARLSRMVDGLLALARAERSAAGSAAATLELRPLLDDRQVAWAPVGEERGVTLLTQGDEPVSVLAGADRVSQVIDNLVANALDASPAGGRITLTEGRQGPYGVLQVVDEGPGLPADDLERAFDRFWRAANRPPTPRGAEQLGGSGLGLPIVRKLVEVDSGTVELTPGPGGRGIAAVVRYPLAPAG